MRLLLLLLLPVLGLCSCRVHTLEDGAYGFAVTQVIRDDCALVTTPGVITDGVLRTTGGQAQISYGYLNLELVGVYLNSLEQLTLDGSTGNVSTQVRGQECLLDTVTLHMDTVTQSPTSFTGQMSFALAAKAPDACVCKLWVAFQATHK